MQLITLSARILPLGGGKESEPLFHGRDTLVDWAPGLRGHSIRLGPSSPPFSSSIVTLIRFFSQLKRGTIQRNPNSLIHPATLSGR